ncbi:MAG: hypothetical protein KF789_13295 [Bdellovibrionaceae bacterium]|nr:hypothetical protein [Pseudobdellovibrionaceae bacterium]
MSETRSFLRAIQRGFFAIFLGTLFFTGQEARAARGAFALYQFDHSHDSKCVPTVSNPDSVLAQNGISTVGAASSGERQALANGIAKVQHLLGGRTLPSSWRTKVNYVTSPNAEGKFTWNQGLSMANAITVRRPQGSAGGMNETRLMHELGHKVGGAGNYGKYSASVGKCNISPYCSSRVRGRNEEFAEAFAAFVTRPSHLKTVCPDAYAFFEKQVFPGSNAAANCGESMDGEGLMLAGAERRAGEGGFVRNRCSKNLFCWLFKIGCPPCADTSGSGTAGSGTGGSGKNERGQR